MTIGTHTEAAVDLVLPAGKPIRVLAWILALGTIAFAVVNVVYELTGRFEEGPLSEYEDDPGSVSGRPSSERWAEW